MFLCRFVFASVDAKALTHHQHEVLFTASKRYQVLVGLGHQRFLNTQMHRYSCYDDVLINTQKVPRKFYMYNSKELVHG